jgi:hypothetical protein
MPLTLHAEVRGSNPLGSTVKLPANDEEIENSGRHAGGTVQQLCRNPSKSPEEVFYHIGAIWIAYTATSCKYDTFSEGWLTLSQKEIVVTFVVTFKRR